MTFRITQCTLRGQFANAACFEKWLEANDTVAKLVTIRDCPGLPPGGVNDTRFYLWEQLSTLTFPTCKPDPGIQSSGGKNGWETQAEAQAVIDAALKVCQKIDAQVKAANEKAVSAENIVGGAVEELADKAGKGLDTGIGKVAAVVAVVAGAWTAWKIFGK